MNNIRLPGQYFDTETGLHYNWHRYYDPSTGRYFTPDPLGLAADINLFAYAQNTPINQTDTVGLKPGDIYLFKHTGGWASVIAVLSPGGSYGHAAIELPGRQLLTATAEGVDIQNLDNEIQKSFGFDIFRPLKEVDVKLLNQFSKKAKQYNTGGYNVSGLFGLNFGFYNSEIKDEYTCSEVVYDASKYSGNNLGYMGSLISPNDISKNPNLRKLHWTEVVETLWGHPE